MTLILAVIGVVLALTAIGALLGWLGRRAEREAKERLRKPYEDDLYD